MPEKKNGNGISAFWNLTNTVVITTFLVIAGLFSYLALSTRSNAADISTNRSKANVNAALISVLSESIPEMREQLGSIDKRLYRLEAHFNTLPKEAKK